MCTTWPGWQSAFMDGSEYFTEACSPIASEARTVLSTQASFVNNSAARRYSPSGKSTAKFTAGGGMIVAVAVAESHLHMLRAIGTRAYGHPIGNLKTKSRVRRAGTGARRAASG